jgi:16S rRNA (guanine1516-N2)-methyltransferase
MSAPEAVGKTVVATDLQDRRDNLTAMLRAPAKIPPTLSHPIPVHLALVCADPARTVEAEALATETHLPLRTAPEPGDDLVLALTPERLELRDCRDPRLGPVYADHSHLDLRPYSPNLSRRQPFARAFGKKAKTIVDATGGYAQDALLLALMGFRVTAIERSPVTMALARDGLRRFAAASGLSPKLQLLSADALSILPALAPRPDAIYLDPMFPPKRRKSAAVRKEMRLLRDLVGDDTDAGELLALARTVALDRVVVKRPDDAAPLAPDADAAIHAKLVRYDIYLCRNKHP